MIFTALKREIDRPGRLISVKDGGIIDCRKIIPQIVLWMAERGKIDFKGWPPRRYDFEGEDGLHSDRILPSSSFNEGHGTGGVAALADDTDWWIGRSDHLGTEPLQEPAKTVGGEDGRGQGD